MGLLDSIMSAGGGSAVSQVAQRFGLSDEQAQSAISALLPHVEQGFQRQASSEDGLSSLMGSLAGGRHEK
jgi:hypothetical protein